MKFYCIIRSADEIHNRESYEYLKTAVEKRGHEFVPIEANNFDYLNGLEELRGDGVVYRLGLGKRSALLEVLMVNKGMQGLYADVHSLFERQFSWGSVIRMQNADLQIIPTIFNLSKNEDARLKQYVEYLGGFPVIVKSAGASHGVGVMKIDSINSLRSVVGFITDEQSSQFILRKFIESARHLRLVVLNGKVVDTIEYNTQDDDFRTNNVAVPSVMARNDVSEEIKRIAVDAVECLDLEFGGVDILIDQDGVPYIAEANFPCNFARNQMTTGTDIAGMIVDHLMSKTPAVR